MKRDLGTTKSQRNKKQYTTLRIISPKERPVPLRLPLSLPYQSNPESEHVKLSTHVETGVRFADDFYTIVREQLREQPEHQWRHICIFNSFARAIFIFIHCAAIPVLSTTRHDPLFICVNDLSSRSWQQFQCFLPISKPPIPITK